MWISSDKDHRPCDNVISKANIDAEQLFILDTDHRCYKTTNAVGRLMMYPFLWYNLNQEIKANGRCNSNLIVCPMSSFVKRRGFNDDIVCLNVKYVPCLQIELKVSGENGSIVPGTTFCCGNIHNKVLLKYCLSNLCLLAYYSLSFLVNLFFFSWLKLFGWLRMYKSRHWATLHAHSSKKYSSHLHFSFCVFANPTVFLMQFN